VAGWHDAQVQLPRALRIRLKRLSSGGVGHGRDGERVVARLGLRPGMRVADIGAGFGDFAARFAMAVGREGRVLAVDVDPDLREEVARLARDRGLPQLDPVAASPDDPNLPEPVDLVFLASSFHHLPEQAAWFARLRTRLRPGATIAILEPRPTTLTGWFGHATRPDDVRATMEAAGYRRLWRDDLVRLASFQSFAPAGPGDPGSEPGRDEVQDPGAQR
jgi:SAM-dependent methyltransferase